MDKYEVMLYPKAVKDIESIYRYIANVKLAPENAKGQTDRIWDAIKALETFPSSHQYRTTGRYAGKKYHQLPVDHYLIIFKVEETRKLVYIVTVQYQGHDI